MKTGSFLRPKPTLQPLYAIPGPFAVVVPQGVYLLTVFLRGGGGAGGGATNSFDGYCGAGGGSGFDSGYVTMEVEPGQVLTGTVGKGGKGGFGGFNVTPLNGNVGGTTTFESSVANGGGGGQAAIPGSYVLRAGGIGLYDGSDGATQFSEYYLGGNGAGTSENGVIFIVNGPSCLDSRGGNSTVTHSGFKIQQFPLGHFGALNNYSYVPAYTAYYGAGGGGAGDFADGGDVSPTSGGLGGGGGGASYWVRVVMVVMGMCF